MKRLLPILLFTLFIGVIIIPGDSYSKDILRDNPKISNGENATAFHLWKPVYEELGWYRFFNPHDYGYHFGLSIQPNHFDPYDFAHQPPLTLNPNLTYKTMESKLLQPEVSGTNSVPGGNFITVHTLLTFQKGNTTAVLPHTFLMATTPSPQYLLPKQNFCYMFGNN